MFLQLDTIVECYLITIPISFPSIPLHCRIMLSKMRHLWTSDDGFLRCRLLQPFIWFGIPDCHLRSRVELVDDVTNEKFIVAEEKFRSIRHFINSGSGKRRSRWRAGWVASFWWSSWGSCLSRDGKRSSRCDRSVEQNCFVLVSVRED